MRVEANEVHTTDSNKWLASRIHVMEKHRCENVEKRWKICVVGVRVGKLGAATHKLCAPKLVCGVCGRNRLIKK